VGNEAFVYYLLYPLLIVAKHRIRRGEIKRTILPLVFRVSALFLLNFPQKMCVTPTGFSISDLETF